MSARKTATISPQNKLVQHAIKVDNPTDTKKTIRKNRFDSKFSIDSDQSPEVVNAQLFYKKGLVQNISMISEEKRTKSPNPKVEIISVKNSYRQTPLDSP